MLETTDRPPFVLYVVWHPGYIPDEIVAELMHHHFGTDRYSNIVGGAGVSVLFRNANVPGSATPLPIDWDEADATAAVVLLDSALANDSAWMQYVQELIEQGESKGFTARVFPVAMETGVPDALRHTPHDIQALPWYRWAGSQTDREQRLLRELTYEFSRMLRYRLAQGIGNSEDNLRRYRENIQVFLSHSKHDDQGELVANAVRDWLHDNSALSSFLDVYDIPAGLSSSAVIFDTIRDGIMVTVYTDSYSSREWCRREVIEAKRRNIPMLVIDCLQTIDVRSFPYLGNVPVIRMDPESRGQVGEVAGRLLDELFKSFLWRCRVERFREPYPQIMFIPRSPELISLVAMPDNFSGGERSIVYPGPPLSMEEAQLFADVVPNVGLHTLADWLMED